MFRTVMATALGLACLAPTATPVAAQEKVLRAVSVFRPGTVFYPTFQQFVDDVNAEGKGIVQIDIIGGPEAMPPFEVGNALRSGVVDLANTTAVFHANLSTEGLAMTLTEKTIQELRENGGYDLLNQIQRDKAGIHWLGRTVDHVPYHIYLSQRPQTADFRDMKLRSTPVYQAFFTALGAAPVQTAPGEVYTALERGVVAGYGWPAIGISDDSWQEQTRVRVEPGFYSTEVGIYLGKATWDGLTDEQKAFLEEQMARVEARNSDFIEQGAAEIAKLAEAGVELFEVPDPDAFRALAQEAGWATVLRESPEHGPRLKELLAD